MTSLPSSPSSSASSLPLRLCFLFLLIGGFLRLGVSQSFFEGLDDPAVTLGDETVESLLDQWRGRPEEDLTALPSLPEDNPPESHSPVATLNWEEEGDPLPLSLSSSRGLHSEAVAFTCESLPSAYDPHLFCSGVVDYPVFLPPGASLHSLDTTARRVASSYPTAILQTACLTDVKRYICATLFKPCVPKGKQPIPSPSSPLLSHPLIPSLYLLLSLLLFFLFFSSSGRW